MAFFFFFFNYFLEMAVTFSYLFSSTFLILRLYILCFSLHGVSLRVEINNAPLQEVIRRVVKNNISGRLKKRKMSNSGNLDGFFF